MSKVLSCADLAHSHRVLGLIDSDRHFPEVLFHQNDSELLSTCCPTLPLFWFLDLINKFVFNGSKELALCYPFFLIVYVQCWKHDTLVGKPFPKFYMGHCWNYKIYIIYSSSHTYIVYFDDSHLQIPSSTPPRPLLPLHPFNFVFHISKGHGNQF